MRRFVLIPLVMTAIVFGAAADNLTALPQIAAAASFTGMLVESACYATLGIEEATEADHTKCAIACAQKGQRLALVTATGDVYMVIGALTQNNNAKLIPLLNRTVVLTGTVAVRPPDNPFPPAVQSDGRRPTGTKDAIVLAKVRKGDFKEGDVPDAGEMTIEVSSIQVATIGIQ
jgi:hypothetical protein